MLSYLLHFCVLHERNMKTTFLAKFATYGHTINYKAVGNTQQELLERNFGNT